MSGTVTDELIRIAVDAGAAAEKYRREMLAASDRRAEAVFALWAEGMPVRKIAEVIGVSPSVSQRLLEKARESRPRLLRREDRVSYELHRAVAAKVAVDPEPVLRKARTNLLRMTSRTHDSYAQGWVAEWDELVNGGDISRLVETMLRPDERGIDLRQMTPFAGVLSQEERLVAIHKAARAA